MPYGICSAPEVFQHQMHELIEGLEGIEVVADDFVAVGFGKSEEEAIWNLDHNQHAHAVRTCLVWLMTLSSQISTEPSNRVGQLARLRFRMHSVPTMTSGMNSQQKVTWYSKDLLLWCRQPYAKR